MVFKDRKHLIPMFLIEPWCLAVVGVEDHVLTSPGSRFLLCCLEELGPYSLSPKALTLSSRFAGRTRSMTNWIGVSQLTIEVFGLLQSPIN